MECNRYCPAAVRIELTGTLTGNPLIDNYGNLDRRIPGEAGTAVTVAPHLRANASKALEELRINTLASDIVPLNRQVPESRVVG